MQAPREQNADFGSLCEAVERLHACRAAYAQTAAVRETFQGNTVWEGEVQVFALEGHPTASRCYAWEEPPEAEGGKAKVYAVLDVPPVRSAADAVRASIVARHRGQA